VLSIVLQVIRLVNRFLIFLQSFSERSGRPAQSHSMHGLLDESIIIVDIATLEEPFVEGGSQSKGAEKARGEEAALKREEALAALKTGVASKLRVSLRIRFVSQSFNKMRQNL
jgi:hypothetical protein